MKLFFSSLTVFMLIALFFYSCGGDKNAVMEKTDISGKNIYKIHCVTCHGHDGKMGALGAKDLSMSDLDKTDAANIITNGKGAMTPFKNLLNEEETQAVADYVQTLKK